MVDVAMVAVALDVVVVVEHTNDVNVAECAGAVSTAKV